MWWCCGKKQKDAPGCKFSKHEEKKDDEEDEDPADKEKNKLKQMKLVKCQCCKQIGHLAQQCERDPNLRSELDAETEENRIQNLRDAKKLFIDSLITTTSFLKNCIKVPKREIRSEAFPDGITVQAFMKEMEIYKKIAFKRGSMLFEDFNYEQFNKYIILIDPE